MDNWRQDEWLHIRPPCRLEKFQFGIQLEDSTIKVDFILDVAHNAVALQKLLDTVSADENTAPTVRVVAAFGAAKDVEANTATLVHHV